MSFERSNQTKGSAAPRILFMGTPEFAQIQLQALVTLCAEKGWELCGVFCQPDRPKNRGKRLLPPPVKEYAQGCGLSVFQPQTLRDAAATELLHRLDPTLIVVAAYGKLLPSEYLHYPRFGCINVHASLLPRYRGAAPIQRALMAGETETGVTLMQMEEGMDTGDMLSAVHVPIEMQDNAGLLFDKLAKAGAALLTDELPKLFAGQLTPEKQDDALATYAPKIEKQEAAVSFDLPAKTLHNQIRALFPSPRAQACLVRENGEQMMLKLDESCVLDEETPPAVPPGTVVHTDAAKNIIAVACGKGVLGIVSLTPPGRGHMHAGDFIRGRKISCADRFVRSETKESNG